MIDSFSIFKSVVALRGWVTGPVAALEIRLTQGTAVRFTPEWLPSPDVNAIHEGNPQCRFDAVVQIGPHVATACGGSLWAIMHDGSVVLADLLGTHTVTPASATFDRFVSLVAALEAPRILEIGSRARSGITRRDLMPTHAIYTGFDIMDGPNVDVVGDAHALSRHLAGQQFDAVMALSVVEHLLMPWKVVLELNAIMAPNSVGLFSTHQCWPLHDQPWDFWRFSDRAWNGLLNKATGFEVIEAHMSEPAYVVAERCHPLTNFPPEPPGFLASSVLFRKIGPTALTWPVELGDAIADSYPA